ncbi:hypothetical protein O181_022257 [Austropuccinia psidii MF-1]|uniref:Uncharacterized protein n=1 Tax=Austropuccinia psidii MF-1 TaxID=1389203 RepID=A0A9Q3CF49_9BASI|nr:hypothetical protein [Austropuccinia psidii MF-1]
MAIDHSNRKVSFSTNVAAEPTAFRQASKSLPTNQSHSTSSAQIRGFTNRHHSSNFGAARLKPLTQLKPEPANSLPHSAIESSTIQKGILTRTLSQSASATTVSGLCYQSQHSQRGTMTANADTNGVYYRANSHGTATSQASLPKLTLGTRYRFNESSDEPSLEPSAPSPHPYDVILPGQETRRPETKTRAMSAATHSSFNVSRAHSSSATSRGFPVGARRFTQTCSSPTQTESLAKTINPAAALHARRYSTIAREPSAAAIIRPSIQTDEVFAEDGVSSAKMVAREDTKIFLIGFKALMGQDGGGEFVGNFLALIAQGGLGKVYEEVKTLISQVLQKIPTLHAAYVTVYFDEIVKQLQKIGGLLFSETELLSLFDCFRERFQAFATSMSPPPREFTFARLFEVIMQKLTSSPIYQSALLKLIETFCQLILASEGLRDGLWAALSEALFPMQPSQPDPKIANITKFLVLAFSAVEQLTGSPIKPLIKRFISWVALVDDLLTKLASETCEFVRQPLPPSIPLPTDYIPHPLGYVYSPTETTAKLDIVMQKWQAVFTKDPIHKEAFDQFKRALDHAVSGILGNSTFARFSSDLTRLWKGIFGDPSEGLTGAGLEGGLECLKILASEFLEIPVPDLKLQHEDSVLVLAGLKLSVMDALPSEVSFSTHSKLFPFNCSFQNSIRAGFREILLGCESVKFSLFKDGAHEPHDQGLINLTFKTDLKIDLIPKENSLLETLTSLPYYGGCEVKACVSDPKSHNVRWDSLWRQLKPTVIGRIEEAVKKYVDSFFQTWLVTQPHSAKGLSASRYSRKSQGANYITQSLQQGPRVLESYGNARDRFKASIQRITGIKTGSVLTQLQNPLSGAGSPLMSPALEEEIDAKRKRRQSMADYLTDVSKADSTLLQNIQRPPVAYSHRPSTNSMNLPNVFDDDDDDLGEYGTMARSLSFSTRGDTTSVDKILQPLVSSKADFNSVLSHRGGMPSFPSVEMSYDDYQLAEASMDEQNNTPVVGIGSQGVPSMAKSLSELATRDTTTEEAIANPPTVDGGSHDQAYSLLNANLTMDKVTRHLSGLADEPNSDVVTPQQRLLRSAASPPELAEKLVMAELLTNTAMEDNTLPETQATGRLSGPVKALGVPTEPGLIALADKEIVAMGKRLPKEASVDTTLPERIADPPGTHHVYRSPVGNTFTGLKVLRSMSMTLNDTIEKDYTTPEAQTEMSRKYNYRPSEGQVTGLTEQEMLHRRQSFKLTKEAMKDMTLIESIRKPPVDNSAVVRPVTGQQPGVFDE